MRGVWWSAFALLLIAAASALRTTQVESTSRISRRLPISSRSPSSTSKVEDIVPTFRPRATRRKEETTTRDISRSRSRSRPTEVPSTSTTLNIIQYTPEQNDRFDSKRSNSRPRNRPSTEASFESINKENIPKTKSRQSNRHVTVQSTQNSLPTTTTSLPKVRPEVNLRENLRDSDDFSKISQDNSNQFRRRSSTVRTTEIVTQPRPRTRANARNNIRALDLEVSGTANALTSTPRDQNKTITEDLRNSKKLRYRTRPTETDTNLTGEGVTTTNERRSSHVRESAPSQIETKRFFPTSSENDIKPSTERISLKTSTIKNMKVVKRPLSRGKTTAPILAEKNKVSDEISEDDNYPDSFKALIQAKNASTQASSPSSESLSVNASQKDTNNYTTTTQTIITAPDVEKEAGLRSKLKLEENKKTENRLDPSNLVETTHAPEQIKPRSVEYRLRGSYSSRKQKQSTSTSSTVSSTTANSSTQRAYKFSRKFKTSTEASKIENPIKEKQNGNSDNTLKIPVRRSSLYTRRNVVNKVNLDSQNITEKINVTKSNNLVKYKKILPRTSYYSRSRNNSVNVTSITDKSVQNDKEEVQVASKKIENSVEMPLIYTYLNSPSKESKNENSSSEANEKPTFIIKVNSKESTESGSENELINSVDDSLNKPVTNIVTTTQKYHATYKDDVISESKEKMLSTATPPIRNLQTRKYARKVTRQREEKYSVTPKPRERNLRKYSDTFSKTTEASSNGIIAEPEKPKNKFSSKYRASYLDKPFYKPTVPTVTPSTAWLKFFVTDHLLTEFIEEPKWFNGEEFSDVTTEQMSRQNITSPTCLHETSLERVEGEEIQLGQDINSISFSKTRSPLYSADLRLSESLVKPPQVMNVEASQHSPSVTVSIFDALAEILTSTPKPRISSTTEVLARQININNDAKQTLDGVSSNINVNSVKGLTSQDTFVSTNIINMSAKSVQITEKTTPNVFNRKTVGENVTPALITEEETTFPVNTPLTLPTPFPNLPTTPISARRPFAIKVLYADTEGPTDKMTALPTSTQPTTENSTMVYNTVSDLILSNNRLVSSELTSMLSNNIKSIIQNMDDASKARLSADMVKVLNSLIPKAMNRLTTTQDDTDFLPNTTPYSLEDIKDTQNVFGNDKENLNLDNENILQTVSIRSIVNSTDGLNNELNVTTVATLDVNSTFSLDVTENIMSASSFPNFVTDVPATTENIDSNLSISSRELSKTASLVQTTDANMISITHIDNGLTVSDSINEPDPPVPFLTNFELNDFSNDKITSNISDMVSASTPSSLQAKELEDIDNIQDPSQLSKLQLWILSKKARVLKMIEDLIRNHNEEILNAPLVELVNNSNQNNVTLSTRLTEIVNTMSLTTQSPDINDLTSQAMTNTEVPTLSTNPFPSSFPTTINSITTENSISEQITEETFETTTSQSLLDNASISSAGSVSVSETASDIPNTLSSSTIMSVIATTVDENIRALDDVLSEITTTNIKDMEFTTLQNMGTNTDSGNIDTTTELSTTTEVNSQTTTLSGTEISTDTLLNNTNDVSAVNSQLNVATPSTIPKKDYVIFGILPNNTVVRKDPNDDALETLTEASPYIIYGVLPNNTVIRKFPNGTRVPRIMQKIDILPISPWSLRNPYSPIHNIPAIVRPQSNPIRVSTNTVTSTDTSNNGSENRLTTDTVNNLQITISSSALNIKDSSSLGITTSTIKSPAEKSTASHVLSLRTTTMLPSVDEILLNSISSATKEEMVISSMTSSTREPRILTLDIDPETKQIRTEKPDDGNGNAVFKFIPIDEVTSLPQESNVQKLASTKMPKTTTMLEVKSTVSSRVIESTTQISQNRNEIDSKQATTLGSLESSSPSLNSATLQPETSITMNDITTPFTNVITESITIPTTTTELQYLTTGDILSSTPTSITTTAVPTSTIPTTIETIPTTIRNSISLSTTQSTESSSLSTLQTDVFLSTTVLETSDSNQKNVEILQSSVQDVSRSAKNLDSVNTITETSKSTQNYNAKLLETLLEGGALQIGGTKKVNNENQLQNTTPRSIEEDIRQFEEDTKLLKALLLATGRNPAELNLPNLDNIKTVITPKIPVTMSTTPPTTTTILSTRPTSTTSKITTPSISDDLRKLQEDTKLLQALLQATGNQNNGNLPIISGITSNVRIASNPLTTSIESSPTTTRPSPVFSTITPGTVTISTLQPQPLTTEVIGISTTFRPYNERSTTTIRSVEDLSTISARRAPNSRLTATTEIPSTSTFSDEEDLLFLQNLKSVLSTKNSNEDPETALANRVIALAVERSLNEIQTGTTSRPTTTPRTTTTTTTTTAAPQQNIPSIEEDIRQFEQDTKLLQALLKATGQDPSKFNIPTLPTTNRPDPTTSSIRLTTTPRPYGAKIAVKDDLKNEQDDAKLLQTLIKLQDAQETTTQRSKLAITGQSTDEALKKLLTQAKPTGMVPEATKSSISLSTEYGNSNDALLAALLKEQGFGPTTASSLDEQLRLAALLNQVVVTPKARRTTTPPPPPPAPRRPILDGLAWLWQQWRETAPGSGPPRPERRPAPSARPSITPSAATSSRVNWFGSGPFVGNADERPTSNRIPLEPPSAVTSEQGPGRGQLVSAAINVTRAFSQFLGAAIQGAAQTVQNVIRAGQRVATDAYAPESG